MFFYVRHRSDIFPQLVLFVFFVFAFGAFFHELGHVIVAKIQGADLTSFELFGSRFYPSFGPGKFEGSLARSSYDGLDYSPNAEAYRLLGGVGFTYLISLLSSTAGIFLKTHNRYVRMVLFAIFLYFLDLVAFTILPRFDLGHLGLAAVKICPPQGCGFSEPLEAARLLGWNLIWFQIAVSLLALVAITLQIFAVVLSNKRLRKESVNEVLSM